MLLIFPPVARPCEPPAGIARLAGALRTNGVSCNLLDANIEALLWLINKPATGTDTWTRRALMKRDRHLEELRGQLIYTHQDRYSQAVRDISRILNIAGQSNGSVVGMADFQDAAFSPVRSADLILSAEKHEQNLFYPWFSQRIPELLDGVNSVGFSLNYLSQAVTTFAMIGFLRKRFPGLSIILGGGLVTSWMSKSGWINPFAGLVDMILSGPGEAQLLSLAGFTSIGANCTLPDYSGLPLDKYFSPGLILPYSAASGCYWNRCSFCPEPAEGNRYLPVPAKRVLTDIHNLGAEYNPSLIHILDNAIAPSLLDGIIKSPPPAPWYGFVRFSNELTDTDYCLGLKNSGCRMLKIGLESGDQGVLDSLNKGIDLSVAAKILENLKKSGIGVYLYLLFGTPAETEADARRTLEFVVKQCENITFLNLAIFNMPISCADANKYATEPFYDGDLSLYTGFSHPKSWHRKQVRSFLEREFKREPAVAEILRRDPPAFTSNHAPFFC